MKDKKKGVERQEKRFLVKYVILYLIIMPIIFAKFLFYSSPILLTGLKFMEQIIGLRYMFIRLCGGHEKKIYVYKA